MAKIWHFLEFFNLGPFVANSVITQSVFHAASDGVLQFSKTVSLSWKLEIRKFYCSQQFVKYKNVFVLSTISWKIDHAVEWMRAGIRQDN